jgi:ABC-type Na+ efflux pump permease subunit
MLGPIFAREWLTLARRPRHYLMRTLFFGVLWVLTLTIWQTTVGWEQTATLGDNARFGLIAFQVLAYVQLTLLLFFAALSAASSISLEKDRRTFILLLLTDLRNHEIVLGKQLGSLLQIGLFLLGTVPVLALLALLGGIAASQVVEALLVLASTALAAGALGSLVALWRDKTFQALALTVLIVVLYLVVIQALGLLPDLLGLIRADGFGVDRAAVETAQGWLHPFDAMVYVVDPPAGPSPAQGYVVCMLGVWALLNAVSIARLRVWNPSGEPIMQREAPAATDEKDAKDGVSKHAAPGPVRAVWHNPILWREIATRAYGRRPLLVKTAYFVFVALVCYFALFAMPPRDWAAAYGLVPIGIVSLLLVATQAVTSITSERDLGALDLLMVTDITPKEFVFGKLLGVLYNTKEYILPPLVLVAVYAVRGQLAYAPPTHVHELPAKNQLAAACLLAGEALLIAFTMVLGLHVALRIPNSRLAVINVLGTVFFLSVGTMICIYLILINGRFEYQWLSFLGFLCAGIGGLWWVLNGDRPSSALTLAAALCPVAVFYTITNILIGKPGQAESSDPLIPFLVTGGAFGFALAAMLIPLLSEFDVAIGRTSAIGE